VEYLEVRRLEARKLRGRASVGSPAARRRSWLYAQSMPEPGFAMAREGLKWHWRAVAWLYRRGFQLSPAAWLTTTLGSGGLAAVGATQLLPGIDGVLATSIPGAVAIGGTAALVEWFRKARRSKGLLVFVSPFDEMSADATRVAPLQVEAVRRMVLEDALLRDRVEVRTLRVPLDAQSCARLLTWTDGHFCVSGEVTTAGGKARWAPWVALRWTWSTWSTGVSTRRGLRISRPKLHPAKPEHMNVDAGVPLVVFAENEIATTHLRGIRAALLLLVAGEVLDVDSSAAAACRVAAQRDADALPTLLQALLVIQDASASTHLSSGCGLKERAHVIAEGALAAGIDHPYLWMEVTSSLAIAELQGESRPSERLDFARRAAALAPTDPGGLRPWNGARRDGRRACHRTWGFRRRERTMRRSCLSLGES